MGCAGCAARINTVLNEQPGVKEASVSFVSGRATVEFDEGQCCTDALVKAVEEAGYGLVPEDDNEDDDAEERETKERKHLIVKVAVAFTLSLAVIILNLVPGDWTGTVAWLLATPVVFWCGGRFFSNAYKQLTHRMCSMDTLVALSTGISYLFSLFNLMFPAFWTSKGIESHLYFEASAMVVTFVLAGRLLESCAKSRTTSAIRKLIGLRPRTVTLIRNGCETTVEVATVVPGDIIVAHPGERIAVDGIVLDGSTYIDESMLTGEPTTVFKEAGAKVYAGTVNQKGSVR